MWSGERVIRGVGKSVEWGGGWWGGGFHFFIHGQ